MPDRTVEHDRIRVPEGTSPADVRVLAEQQAHSKVPEDHRVVFLYLHGATPVTGDEGSRVEWRYSYQSVRSDTLPVDPPPVDPS